MGIDLSICIATRNRADTIGETLESIIREANERVEVVIVDGASTDNTEQVVVAYQASFPSLRYYRLAENGGVDKDYCKAADLALGQYCWFMSDDDIFKEGAVPTVLDKISHGYDLIVVNAESRNIDMSKVLVAQNTVIDSDTVYPTQAFRDFFVNMASHLSYLPAVVIRRSIWNQREKEEYYGSNFVHVGVIFQKPMNGDVLVLQSPLIAVRRGNVSWSSKSFEVWLFKWPRLIWSFSLFDSSAKTSVTHEEPWRKLSVLLRFRGSGYYSSNEYAKWVKTTDSGLLFKLLARAIAVVPVTLLNPIVVLYLIMFRKDSKASVYEIVRSAVLRKAFRME